MTHDTHRPLVGRRALQDLSSHGHSNVLVCERERNERERELGSVCAFEAFCSDGTARRVCSRRGVRSTRTAQRRGSPAGTRRLRGLCLGAGRRSSRATAPFCSAYTPLEQSVPRASQSLAPRKQGSQNREAAMAAWPTARTAGQTLPVTAQKHAGMALRTLRYLPGG